MAHLKHFWKVKLVKKQIWDKLISKHVLGKVNAQTSPSQASAIREP